MALSRLDCQTRGSLYSAIQKQPTDIQEAINVGVETAIRSGIVKYGKKRESRKDEDRQGPSKRPRLREEKKGEEVEGEN